MAWTVKWHHEKTKTVENCIICWIVFGSGKWNCTIERLKQWKHYIICYSSEIQSHIVQIQISMLCWRPILRNCRIGLIFALIRKFQNTGILYKSWCIKWHLKWTKRQNIKNYFVSIWALATLREDNDLKNHLCQVRVQSKSLFQITNLVSIWPQMA